MKLPRFTATTPPPRETGLVRAQDIGALTDVGSAKFRAIEGAGRAIQGASRIAFQSFMNRQALDDQQKMGEISIKSQEAERLGVSEIGLIDMQEARPLPNEPDYYKGDKIPDSASWAKSNERVFADYKKRILDLSAAIKNPKTRQAWENSRLVRGSDSFGKISRAKYNEYQKATFLDYAKTSAENGDIEMADSWIEIAEKHNLITHGKAVIEKDKNEKIAVTAEAISFYQVGQYQAARDLAASSNLAIKDKESLLKTIDLIEKHNKRKTIDLDHEADMKVNEDFVSQIINRDLLPDVVQNSRLDDKTPRGIFSTDKLSKQEWLQYVGASFDALPTKTTPKGYSTASSVVFDYAKFQIPKEAAYRRLLDSRYIGREITDEDFAWAINHISKPYPRHLVADIETVTQSNRDAIARGGFLWGLITTDAEEEKARSVNSELISWIDNEIAQDREPTREQMNNKSAQLRAQSGEKRVQKPIIDTQAEYDKLPSGTEWQDAKTGEWFRKP